MRLSAGQLISLSAKHRSRRGVISEGLPLPPSPFLPRPILPSFKRGVRCACQPVSLSACQPNTVRDAASLAKVSLSLLLPFSPAPSYPLLSEASTPTITIKKRDMEAPKSQPSFKRGFFSDLSGQKRDSNPHPSRNPLLSEASTPTCSTAARTFIAATCRNPLLSEASTPTRC